AHEILNVWSTNNIFPPNYSFRKVCFCDECSTMIDELNDFAESTRSLLESVMVYIQKNLYMCKDIDDIFTFLLTLSFHLCKQDITSFVSQLIIRDTSQHAHSTVFEFCSKERVSTDMISFCPIFSFIPHKLGVRFILEENKLRDKQIEIQKVIAESGIVPDFEINRVDEKDLSCVAECIRFDIGSRGIR
ncbi:zinc finger protein, partial [Striga asiatica]